MRTFHVKQLSDDTVSVWHASIADCLDRLPVDVSVWLSAVERTELARLSHRGRRDQWLAGRWVAKQLVAGPIKPQALADLRIISRDGRRRGVKPELWLGSLKLDWSLSISHSDRGVLAALAASDEIWVGVDLAAEIPASESFDRAWFSPTERRWMAIDRRHRATTLWGVKEAVYKAVNTGDSWEPRDVEAIATTTGGLRLPVSRSRAAGFVASLRARRRSARGRGDRAARGVCICRTND